MTAEEASPLPVDAESVVTPASAEVTAPAGGGGPLGPATWTRALVLGLALAVLGGAIGWVVAQRDEESGLSADDIGFLQDMYAHHTQAVQMSKALLYKDDMPREIRSIAEEILSDQRFEQGVYNTVLSRDGTPTENPSGMAMGWMGAEVPVGEMSGMATDAQMKALTKANGDEAQALFIALMSEHHLGGIHMADYEYRNGKDKLVRGLASAAMRNQRSEVIEMEDYRVRAKLPLPEGFKPATEDPRLNPIGLQLGN